jgi:hypothetical protein
LDSNSKDQVLTPNSKALSSLKASRKSQDISASKTTLKKYPNEMEPIMEEVRNNANFTTYKKPSDKSV